MSDKTFGRVVIAVCLVVLLLLALTSCAAVPEVKPDIPDDLSLTCCRGQSALNAATTAAADADLPASSMLPDWHSILRDCAMYAAKSAGSTRRRERMRTHASRPAAISRSPVRADTRSRSAVSAIVSRSATPQPLGARDPFDLLDHDSLAVSRAAAAIIVSIASRSSGHSSGSMRTLPSSCESSMYGPAASS